MGKNNKFLIDDDDYDYENSIDDNDIDEYYQENTGKKRDGGKRRIGIVVVAFTIIVVLIVGGAGLYRIIDKYTPNREEIDLYTLLNIDKTNNEKNPVAYIRYNREETMDSAYFFDDAWYFKKDFVDEKLNSRFYFDEGNNELIYTTPTKILTIPFESQAYYVDDTMKKEHYIIAKQVDDTIYIAVDFVKERTDFIYELRTDPYRMLITTEYGTVQYISPSDKSIVRTGPSIKNPIIDLGDDRRNWTVVSVEDEWSRIVTDDGITGYVRSKELTGSHTITYINNFQAPLYTDMVKPYKVNLVWHAVYGMKDNDKIYGYLDNTKGVTTVSPTWYQLTDAQGNFNSYAQREYVDYIHETGREIWPLFSDFNSVDPNNGFSEIELFGNTANRRALIAAMMDEVREYGYDGINIDFEKVTKEAGIHYVQFLRELSIECRKESIVLSVDNYVPMPHTEHYNRREQGVVADYVIVMGYDEHYNGGDEIGSVASLDFVKLGIERTMEVVPANKVINALPYYTRIWDEYVNESGAYTMYGKAYSMSDALDWVEQKGYPVNWAEGVGQYVAEGDEDGHHYTVWLEEARSIGEKMKLVHNYNIGGVAGWSLGSEYPEVWDMILQYLD